MTVLKTAAGVLQEMAVKLGLTLEFELIAQNGPQHKSTFEYRCTLLDQTATAIARSKKDAKQEVAGLLLVKLAEAGHKVPAPWGLGIRPPTRVSNVGVNQAPRSPDGLGADALCPPVVPDPFSYVALLKEYCEEYKLPEPDYALIGDTGPPHSRIFTYRVTVGSHSRDATAATKKTARQMAAETIYKYLRGSLRSTLDFVEGDALVRSLDKRMGRFTEERTELPFRPTYSQKISEYHYGLIIQLNEQKRAAALEAIRETSEAGQPPEIQLACAVSELGLELEWNDLPTKSGVPLITVEIPNTSPSVVHLGDDRNDAAANMIRYLQTCLPTPKVLPPSVLISMENEKEKQAAQV